MKTSCLLLSTFSLLLLLGCSSSDGEVVTSEIIPPECKGCFEGDVPVVEPVIVIEYFDKEGVGYHLLGNEERVDYMNSFMTFENISVIDEITGKSLPSLSSVGYKGVGVDSVYRNNFMYGTERFGLDAQESIHHYVLKYKAFSFKEGSTEEIKGIYHHYGGLDGEFTEVWYNGKSFG